MVLSNVHHQGHQGHQGRKASKGAKSLLLCALGVFCGVLATAQDLNPSQTIRIGVLKNGAYEIVTLPVETYVARVLAGEALPGSEPAALETLAIAIRTYALGNRGRHRADGFDLCDQTHCQVMRTSNPATERAAVATAGEILLYKGQPATVYYSASCGGRTEKPSNVWPGAEDPPYLPSQPDDGCEGAPEWSSELSIGDLERALRSAGFSGMLRNMRVVARNESGRAAGIALDGMTPSQISGQDLRSAVGRTLGWQYIQSAAFQLKRSGNAFRFAGHGSGHGVGLCVIGSAKLAAAGETATDILKRYFPGTTIGTPGPRFTAIPPQPERPSLAPPPRTAGSNLPAPAPKPPVTVIPSSPAPSSSTLAPMSDIVIALPEGDEGERSVIAALIRRERDGMARTLGVAAPARLTVRFHPTTEAFERAAGHPWFTLGAANGSDLQFVPLTVLRDRGVLERAIRRQLVYLLIAPSLASRPAWVSEGAAVHFSEGENAPAVRRVVCPDDVEITRPVSVGAFGDASRRARACFERQLSARKDWREVK